ncbi:hypothetical protein Daura_22550 [Dactylosporangium aurantiacum]|uniref:Transmembrane protein n=1 Tax=Dactylosporangium aurantiacum TaxID=35754 RepID=A0A9Q9IRP5_9ACTN|nr:hypothetical protein [Dactylosporangium aurantiacum]MDG6107710.1 hypothetical protein [Dactylosporangium aurantiacum]UWZ58700.1 hypothetical protein Daura_22550 [Dactylosporangium aurantiacum]
MKLWYRSPALCPFIGICFLVLGVMGTLVLMASFVLAWQTPYDGGRTGTFTLTEFKGCDRFKPPEQRCRWYGDFVSDDGAVVHSRQELVGGYRRARRPGRRCAPGTSDFPG